MGIADRVRGLFRRRKRNRIDERRSVYAGDGHTEPQCRQDFCDNTVTSSKYNIITFLPLNLFDQLQRPISIYFVLISALQFIPSVAPVNPYTTLFPLAVALLANTIKEGFDDLRRHRQDRENNRRTHRIVDPRTRRTREVPSKDIRVGDVVVLGPAEVVPCDVVLLFTSGAYGEALISTASIDGETGTKERRALLNDYIKRSPHDRETTATCTSGTADRSFGSALLNNVDIEAAMAFTQQSQLILDAEGPNPFLHTFTGTIQYSTPPTTTSNTHNFDVRRAPVPPLSSVSTPSASAVRQRLLSGTSSNSNFEADETSRLLASEDGPGSRNSHRAQGEARTAPLPPFTDARKLQAVTSDNVILSYSRIENTRIVLGLAVFTGMETKLSMTRNTPTTKVASIDRSLNLLVIPIFAFQFTLVVIYSLLSCIHLSSASHQAWYLGITRQHGVPSNEFFPVLPLRFFTMLSPMVPMSFKSMLELSKAYVSAVISWDEGLAYEGKPVMVNNSALAEELGKVEYVLSDKTGTLTQNEMRFRCLVTANEPPALYEHVSACHRSGDAAGDSPASTPDTLPQDATNSLPFVRVNRAQTVPHEVGSTTEWLTFAMAFCNTIEPAMSTSPSQPSEEVSPCRDDAADSHPRTRWLSVSPDEVALVEGAEALGGLRLMQRSRHRATADYVVRRAEAHGAAPMTVSASVCRVLPFTSDRGRMSVLLCVHREGAPCPGEASSPAEGGDYVVLMKGSDERVLPLCRHSMRPGQFEEIGATLEWLASLGLRTLVYAYRRMSAADATRWLESYETLTARCVTADDRQACIKKLYGELESDLHYCGCTAVEDLLQEALPETISQLRHAGIRTWVLTGDRTETARQTAVASGLLRPCDAVVSLIAESTATRQTTADHFGHVKHHIDRVYGELERLGVVAADDVSTGCSRWSQWWRRWYAVSGLQTIVQEFTNRRRIDGDGAVLKPLNSKWRSIAPYCHMPLVQAFTTVDEARSTADLHGRATQLNYCVLLSGGVTKMVFASSDAELRRRFRLVLLHAQTVICSRSAPDQKALFVDMVRASGKVTLAIGDGGNDVAMIQSANVGVGICGREGSQAALAADFAIGEFRLLARLLLVHGHMAYARSAMIIQQSFWKTVLVAWVQMLFNYWTDFSGVSYWDSFSLMLYNAIPTVPVTFLCVMDVPLSSLQLLQNPQLYVMSQRGRYLNASTFYGYVLRALLHGSLVFLLSTCLQSSGTGGILRGGWELDRQGDFYAAYFAVVTIHTFTVCIESHSITFAHWQCFIFSVWSCFLCFGLAAATPGANQSFSVLLRNPSFYLHYMILTGVVSLSLSLYATVKVFWFPDLLQLQRMVVHTVSQGLFRRVWGAAKQRLLCLLWSDENPSTFWGSLLPLPHCHSSSYGHVWEEEVTTGLENEQRALENHTVTVV